MKVPFLGPSGSGRSPNVDPTRSVNLFPDVSVDPEAKTPLSMVGTPGLSLVSNLGPGPTRALYALDGKLYQVSGDTLYQVLPATSGSLGTLDTPTGLISMSDNGVGYTGQISPGVEGNLGGNQIAIVDGVSGYMFNVSTKEFVKITDDDFPDNPSHISFLDGYFVVTNGTMSHYASDLYDGLTWNGLASSPVLATTDTIRSHVNHQNQLYLIKGSSSEIWRTSGVATSAGSPFQRLSGAVLDIGTQAPSAVVCGAGAIWFPAYQRMGDTYGFIGVVGMTGGTFQVVSTPTITYRMSKMTVESAIAYMYSEGDHTFYVITFPDDNATFVYDVTTKLWHERSSYNASVPGAAFNRHVGNCYAFYEGKHYVGDYRNGSVYEMSDTYFKDGDQPIVRTRITGHLFDPMDAGNNLFVYSLFVDVEMGTSAVEGITEEPFAALCWSKDRGWTWGSQRVLSLGKSGEYAKRLKWWALGAGMDFVWRLDISHDARVRLLGAYAEVSR